MALNFIFARINLVAKENIEWQSSGNEQLAYYSFFKLFIVASQPVILC